MAAASLGVSFKEELSAIEQCWWLPNSLLVSLSHISYYKVPGCLQSRAHSRSSRSYTTFYSSADPLLHRRPATNGQGRPNGYTSEPGRRGIHAEPDGSQTCQYGSQVSRTQVQRAQFPLGPHFQHQCHESPVASLRLILILLISRFHQFCRQPKRRRSNTCSTACQAQSS